MINLEEIVIGLGVRGFTISIIPNPIFFRDGRDDGRSKWFIDLKWRTAESSYGIRRFGADTYEEVIEKTIEASHLPDLQPTYSMNARGHKLVPGKSSKTLLTEEDKSDLFSQFNLD